MGPEGAVSIIFRKELEEATARGDLAATRARLISEYREKFSNPWEVAELGFIDAVIEPASTRSRVIESLKILEGNAR